MPTSRSDTPSAGALLEALETAAPRPLTLRELARRLALERFDPRRLERLLDEQVARRRVRRIGKSRYQWVAARELPRERAPRAYRAPGRSPDGAFVEGRYSRARAGFGFVAVEGPERRHFPRDVFIPEGAEGAALHGDRVRAAIVRRDVRTQRASGEIVAVVASANERVIGVLDDALRPVVLPARPHGRGGREPARRWWLVPQSDLLPVIEVKGGIEPTAFDAGKLAVVRLTRPPGRLRGPAGELERVLGDAEDPEVQFLTIALEHGLRIEFPPEAVAEAARFPVDPAPSDLRDRADLRALPFVTIDGENARDFDDAVAVEALPGGGRRLRVAIADVAHYVGTGSAIDAEARARGTSVYFPDRAVPMLPEALSNGLCSLLPERDRLVMVAEVDLDRRGARQAARFVRAVIRSRARLTYGQVAAVLSATETAAVREQRSALADLLPELRQMRDLMRLLYRRRIDAGSLDLDLPEALIDLSEEGRSVGVRLSVRNDAHRIIEELMLEANQAVAHFLGERDVPFPYRVHEPPDPTDVEELNQLLDTYGLHVEFDAEAGVKPRDVQRVLRALEGHPLARVLSRQVLRALKLAEYSTENRGHFGLGFPIYCHFTSPIRRYPDLLVHRQLGAVLGGAVDEARELAQEMAALSLSSSQRERDAVDAERAMLDLKKAEFMLDHLMEPLPATVVSVAKFGLFVELDAYPIEGRVGVDQLPERFEYDERAQALVGTRTGARFRLGDRLLVEANDVSLRRRQIGFAVVEHLGHAARASEPRVAGAKRVTRRRPRR